MNRNSIRYRDTWAAPGSALYSALEASDTKLAERIYQQCEREARELLERSQTQPTTMKQKLTFQTVPADMRPFFIDGTLISVDAVATSIEDGPHKGCHIFTSRDRAEAFCWKLGFDPEFEDDDSAALC